MKTHNLSIFSTQPEAAGYRLYKVEVFNWGTFHNEIYRIFPQGNTTLLTGKNGSGKTTYIEALLTLLVPEGRKRTYNSASGQKGDRTEESYVLGEFGTAENVDGKFTERHRKEKEKAVSVLLAVFKNEDKFISILQVRWFSTNEMKRNYLIAHVDIQIEKDIFPFDASGGWKKNLKKRYPKIGTKDVVIEYDGPQKYAEGLRKVFGMREKALTLFSQMVGLKVLGNLDEFIRTNMLEESKVEDDFLKLKTNYQKLLDAHTNIEKAKKQLELLKPVTLKASDITVLKSELDNLDTIKQTCPIYFAQYKTKFLETEIENAGLELKRIQGKIAEITLELRSDREREKEIESDIRSDKTGKKIQELEKDIKTKEQEKARREKELKKYNELAIKIDLPENPDEKSFYEQIQLNKDRKTTIKNELNDKKKGLRKRLANLSVDVELLENQYNELATEIEELRKQKNNITGRVSEIRNEILVHTGANITEIPFAGELIRVLSDEKPWEASIEKALHNFALRLIVPDKYYKKVTEYVNDNNLRGRIVYERFRNESYMNSFIKIEENSIFAKIELKRDSEYADWVEHQLKTYYNFICTDRLNLADYEKAITIEGLIKNKTLHEKDDRTNQKQNYVLGWDPKEKIAVLKELLTDLDAKIKEQNENKRVLEKRINKYEEELDCISKISNFDDFTEINWQTPATEIVSLQKQKEELEKADNKVKKLKEQLEVLQQKIVEKEKQKDLSNEERVNKQQLITSYKSIFNELNNFLNSFKDMDWTNQLSLFENEYKKELQEIIFANIDKKQEIITKTIDDNIKAKNKKISESERNLITLMNEFKNPETSVIERFPSWSSETYHLSKDINFVDEYIAFCNRIEEEELINHEQNFKKYLNEDMITQMTNFTTMLETQEDNIIESIESLNEPLKKIEFYTNPRTFIRLYANPVNSGNIREFKIMLKEWKPNQAEYERTKDDSILENSFLKIKNLIDKLTINEYWRKEVTDVRNWLTFTAKEHYFDDDKRPPRNVYENIAKLSSGEQAQITYTIMGAAIAYQYGILKDGLNTNSFRFICVDEAFAKQDEDKAKYLMDLIQKLNLQMLLVTPDDKIHIAENYISLVHIVHRMPDRTSRIFDTTIEQAQKTFEAANA